MGQEVLAVLYFFVPAYVANMSPVFVQGIFQRLAIPIDAGRRFRGKRILGDHKTWRGIIAGVVAGMLVYQIQVLLYRGGYLERLALFDYAAFGPLPGFLLALGTGFGDAVKSFFKRQVGIAPGSSWIGFDQLDFLAGACVFAAPICVPPLLPMLLCVPIIFLGSIAFTATGYELGLKDAWL